MASGPITTTTGAVLIPESWSKDLILSAQQKMVMRDIVQYVPVPKGMDTVHYGQIAGLTAEDITEGTDLTSKNNTETKLDLVMNKNKGVPFSFTKKFLTQVQQAPKMLDVYSVEAGRAIAKAIDLDLLGLYSGLSQVVTCTSVLTDAKILEALLELDNAGAPEDDRHFVITPAQKGALLAIDKFSLVSNFGSSDPLQKGAWGEIYGLKIWVTNNVITATTRKNLMFHRDAFMLGVQQDAEVEVGPYMPKQQGFDVVVSAIYGVLEKRDTFAVTVTTTT